MPTLHLKDFSTGLITQPDKADIPLEALQVAENVDLNDFGKKKKFKGSLLGDSSPSGLTLKSFCMMRFTLPSEQEVKIAHATTALGGDQLWWRPYWDHISEAWVDDWQQLTESLALMTADTNTNTLQIYDSALPNVEDNYYKDWVVTNITRGATAQVYEYLEGSQILNLRDAIAGQTSGDNYILHRYPLRMSVEGPYTADAGTGTGFLIGEELRSNKDDYYDGWFLYNITRNQIATITDYDAATKTITHATISGQGSGDSYTVYISSHDIKLGSLNGGDDKVRFYKRENAVEISVGVDDGFPVKAPLWFGYITERHFLDLDKTSGSSANTKFSGFWMCRNVLDAPDKSCISLQTNGAAILKSDTYYFRAAFVYDGYQESVLSEPVSIEITDTSSIDITINLPLWSNNTTNRPSFFEAILNKRITGIKVYAAKGDQADSDLDYFLLANIPTVDISDTTIDYFSPAGVYDLWTRSGDLYTSAAFNLRDEEWSGGKVTYVSGIAFGKFRRWDVEQGHRSSRIDANYRHRATLQETHYKAPIHSDQAYHTIVGYSLESDGAGVPNDDVMPAENYLPALGPKGANRITGLSHLNGELIILAREKIFRYSPNQYLVSFADGKGNVAPDGYVEYAGVLYYCGVEDVYAFNGVNAPTGLMYGRIIDQWNDISAENKEVALTAYRENSNTLWIYAGGTMFIYDIRNTHWKTYTPPETLNFMAANDEGNLFACSGTAFYELESDSFDQNLLMHTKSKIIDFTSNIGGRRVPVRARIKRFLVRHSGGEKLVYKLYDPIRSTSYPLKTINVFPGTEKPYDVDKEFEKLEIDMLEESYSGNNQPTHEVTEEIIEYEVVLR